MPRSVNTVASRKRRKKILKKAKGYFGRRKNVYTVAKNAVEKALSYAYRDRKNRKRVFRSLWITRINAGAREHGLSYSELISKLKSNNILINRKAFILIGGWSPKCFTKSDEKWIDNWSKKINNIFSKNNI